VRSSQERAIRALITAVSRGERIDRDELVAALSPPLDVPSPRALEEARREATRRTRILRDFGAYRAGEVAALVGSSAADRSQLAYRWRRRRRILAVPHQGEWWYLGFQFDPGGQPLPAVSGILAALREWDEWDIAAWFVRPHPLLGRRRPVDVLDEPAEVVSAARADSRRADARRTG
jgi:hypothetical protein